jgi:DNA-binding NarL/FixJ family response regulator
MTTRILVADDHEVVRRGIRALLESHPGWNVCGEASTGHQAVHQARRLKPDLLIVDISMPEMNGLETIRQIHKSMPQIEILVLTMHESEQMMREAVAAGARGYLSKSEAARDLLAAVESLRAHKPFFDTKATEMMLEGYRNNSRKTRPSIPPPPAELTPREREIVQLLAEGRTSKEVAAALGISLKTVDTHRTNLMRKLGIHSIGELVRYALRNNIIQV